MECLELRRVFSYKVTTISIFMDKHLTKWPTPIKLKNEKSANGWRGKFHQEEQKKEDLNYQKV